VKKLRGSNTETECPHVVFGGEPLSELFRGEYTEVAEVKEKDEELEVTDDCEGTEQVVSRGPRPTTKAIKPDPEEKKGMTEDAMTRTERVEAGVDCWPIKIDRNRWTQLCRQKQIKTSRLSQKRRSTRSNRGKVQQFSCSVNKPGRTFRGQKTSVKKRSFEDGMRLRLNEMLTEDTKFSLFLHKKSSVMKRVLIEVLIRAQYGRLKTVAECRIKTKRRRRPRELVSSSVLPLRPKMFTKRTSIGTCGVPFVSAISLPKVKCRIDARRI
jgi:hypothetical protein